MQMHAGHAEVCVLSSVRIYAVQGLLKEIREKNHGSEQQIKQYNERLGMLETPILPLI